MTIVVAVLDSAPSTESDVLTQHPDMDSTLTLSQLKDLQVEEGGRQPGLPARVPPEERKPSWAHRIAAQGPWDPETDKEFSLNGPPSQPMPVLITAPEEFRPFFEHLAHDGSHRLPDKQGLGRRGLEPANNIDLLEFPRGVLYADRRMDLCKQVLGPASLPPLLEALRNNDFVRQFLFGNNIVGPRAAKQIATFVRERDVMETWYLAGNCITSDALKPLVDAWIISKSVTNIWLKRNPLGPSSSDDLFRLITQTPNLRTLDLDQTSLSDAGVASLFTNLATYTSTTPIPLRHLYLNGVGASTTAANAISTFLDSPHCNLISLYLGNNPLGSPGCTVLAPGIASSSSLERLSLQSVGLTDTGAVAILDSAAGNLFPRLRMLDLSQSYATEDLGARYNYLTDAIVPAVQGLLSSLDATALQYLDLGQTQLSPSGLNAIHGTFLENTTAQRLLYLNIKPRPLFPGEKPSHAEIKAAQLSLRLSKAVTARLHVNVEATTGMSYKQWWNTEKRFVVSPRDVRKIDSVYRNRDAGLARRGLVRLEKWWSPEDEWVLEGVMAGDEIATICSGKDGERLLDGHD